ncbi:MAG: hypothetical protein K1X48_08945 [Burkholderiaceae bacterium]|nr:hypothetical protein [Burkholderiaceae bacterium]
MQLIVSLLAIALLCIIGTWAWGRWQIAKLRENNPHEQTTTIIRATRHEPLMFLPTDEKIPRPEGKEPSISFVPSLDPDTELIATLTPNQAIDEVLFKQTSVHRTSMGRRIIRYCWLHNPVQIQMGISLADRTGAISEAELNKFLQLVDDYADRWSADVNVEPVQVALTRACVIDAQCAALDTQIYLHLAASHLSFSQEQLLQVLGTAGLEIETASPVHYLKDNAGQELARVFIRMDRPEAFITFVVDIPRVSSQAFERALQAAQQLAYTLGATVVDDNGKPLSDTALALVRARLTDVSRKLTQAGMAPGSERACRLFS